MAAMLSVIWWRDIPAQVIAGDRLQSHKIVLHPRFQTAIDRAAKKAGMQEWSVYLEQWRKEQRACDDDVKAEAEAEAERLEADYPKVVLNRLAQAGGLVDAPGPAPRPGHLAPPTDAPTADASAAPSDATAGAGPGLAS